MGGRYWTSGAQLGTLIALIQTGQANKANDLINKIIEEQFIGKRQDLKKLKKEKDSVKQ